MKTYIFKYKGQLICVLIAILLKASFNVGLAYQVKIVMDLLTREVSLNSEAGAFYATVGGAFAFLTGVMVVSYIEVLLRSRFSKSILLDMKVDLFAQISNSSITMFNSANSAVYISVLTNDVDILEEKYLNPLLALVSDVLVFMLSVLVLCYLSVPLAIVGVLTGAIPLLIPKLTQKRMAALRGDYSGYMAAYTARLQDVFTGFEVVKTFNLQKPIVKEFERENTNLEDTKVKTSIFEGIVEALSVFSGFAAYAITLAFGVYLALNNLITVGTILASAQLTNNVIKPIVRAGMKINSIKSTAPIAEKIETILHREDEYRTYKRKSTFDSDITFKDVSFSYDDTRPALNGITVKIEKGKKYAIVGHSGSGKSTLFKLILNHYPHYAGDILIDNTSLRDIEPLDLCRLVSIIHQNVFLFDTTIRENIALNQPYTTEAIKQVISLAGLSSLVESLERKEDTYVGEAGCRLSGGEKQRIAIARALIRSTPVLLLDEATASLDPLTAFEVENSILNLAEVTAIVVTHKLSEELLAQYDSILVMKDGCLVEEGHFTELMCKKGHFYSLYTLLGQPLTAVAEQRGEL